MEELDLDSFLNTSDSDSDDHDHTRTVDDILLNDSSDSSNDDVLPTNPKPLSSFQSKQQQQPNSITTTRLVNDDPFSSLGRRTTTRQPLPALFGSVRTNAKPGAALAAAAAASRTAPTPHAAAIKSRRARMMMMVLNNQEEEIEERVSSTNEVNESDIVVLDKSDESVSSEVVDDNDTNVSLDGKNGNFESESERVLGESGVLSDKDVVEIGDRIVGSRDEDISEETLLAGSNEKKGLNFADKYNSVVELESNDDANAIAIVASTSGDGNDNGYVEIVEEHVTYGDDFEDEDSMAVSRETREQDKDIGSFRDGEVSGTSEEIASKNEIDELVEDMIAQWESKRGSKKDVKKSRTSMKPLELAEELEKKHASTGLHWEEGAAAQPMRLEGIRRGSIALGYFDINADNTITRIISSEAFRRDHGSPQVLAIHLNNIAVGMSKGVIVVVPSKYSAQYVDNMDGKMSLLGILGEKSNAPVTSMCFNQQGDTLLAGYGDGHFTVWDVHRASAAKVVTGEHNAPVVHAFFLGQDSQVTRQFKAVTGDSKGLVLLHAFSVVPLLNRFSVKTQCLLDGQKTGTVLAASPLLSEEIFGGALISSQGNSMAPTSSIGSMMGGVVGGDAGWKLFSEGSPLVEEGVVIFITHQNALVVRLSPSLEVYAQLSKPEGVREGSMPYTAWKYMAQSRGSSAENTPMEAAERVSLLAIAWDRKVQVAKLIKSELKIYGKWTLDSAAIGMAWLDDQMLVVLTLTGQLCLFGKDGTVIHQTSFAVDGSSVDDLVAYHTHFTNIFGNPEKAYHSCVAIRGATIYALGPTHLIVSRLLPWKERIQVLRKAGDWMGALNMAMTLYDGHFHGVIDLPRSLDAVHEVIMPYLVELLLSYVDEVFSYISVAFGNQIGNTNEINEPRESSAPVHAEIKEQFTRVGGVAVEFCVHIKRTDILFDEIFSKFVAVKHRDTFLELLEPYILRDMLGSLLPEIMQALVEHYSSKGWLQRVEQCVLHMDISSVDFNQVVRLCREHGLYGALVYLFNRGLDDFRAPLEELLVVLRNSPRENAAALGYRMLVYLKYCFSGVAFPPGHGKISPSRLPSLRTELMKFLLEDSDGPKSKAVSHSSPKNLNVYHLLEIDTEATLDVLRCAFVEDENPRSEFLLPDPADATEAKNENDSIDESVKLLVQNTVDALVHIIDTENSLTDISSDKDDAQLAEVWPSKKDIGHLFEFIGYYVASQRAVVSKNVLSQIFKYLTSENIEDSKRREKQVLALLEVVPETEWDAYYMLQLCEGAQFYQACGFIHTARRQYLAALDSYTKDVDEPVHAFSFINNTLLQLTDTQSAAFRSAVICRIPDLVNLSREGTFFLVIDHFEKESEHILSELRTHPRSLFLYLKTVIEVHLSGTLDISCLRKKVDDSSGKVINQQYGVEAYLERFTDLPKLLRNNSLPVTDEMVELYFEMLCQYERNSVLKFLETFENYRVEHCLRLCQQYGIIDAAAFLLERVGDVGSALLLTLSGIRDKFLSLDSALESMIANETTIARNTVLNMKEVDDIRDILQACIGLCQRNTPRLDPEESESLWFQLLDTFCEPLMGSNNGERSSEENHTEVTESSGLQYVEKVSKVMWRITQSQKGAHLLKRLFSQFIKEIVEGMIGYLRLPSIMSKLLSDNGTQEFGDFKLTILGMLGTYGFERRILDTAKSLIEVDTFYTMSLLKKGACHGYAPRSEICCICNCPLSKNSSSSSIRVFNCGHATHLQCEFLENEASKKGSASGCPVCLPKKKTQRSRSKPGLTENGLFNKSWSKRQQVQGTSVFHPHESDSSENSYGLQQISRFEILNNLQKNQRSIQLENMPQLRLAPPAVYHEKVKKGSDLLIGESSSGHTKVEKPIKNRQLRDIKLKGSSIRFPLRSNIFGKEKPSKC